jgi:hypothetical protein
VIGGGAQGFGMILTSSYPQPNNTSWSAAARNTTSLTGAVQAYAICAKVT